MPFALAGYINVNSQNGATARVGYRPIHSQQALVE